MCVFVCVLKLHIYLDRDLKAARFYNQKRNLIFYFIFNLGINLYFLSKRTQNISDTAVEQMTNMSPFHSSILCKYFNFTETLTWQTMFL